MPDRTEVTPELPRDRIFVSNYVREMELGAFPGERGTTQRVRFDVALEVAREETPLEDRPARVVSYDDLVDAIETVATGPRANLVETLAERLAELCLVDPRARRVHLRIEKLDRLPGGAGLGVEIVRARGRDSAERAWRQGPEIGGSEIR
jgi:dihydroneopterin aldolase